MLTTEGDAARTLVLIDIREDADRASTGTPELKAKSRYKAAAVPLSAVDALVTSAAGNKGQLRVELAAAVIAGLKVGGSAIHPHCRTHAQAW
jgi:hypothetical protein